MLQSSKLQIANLRRLVESRLNSVASPQEHYPLVYLEHALRKNNVGETDEHEAISLASEGDEDIARLLEHVFARHSALTVEELRSRLERVADEELDAYLRHCLAEQNVMSAHTSTPEGIARLAQAILDVKPGERVVDLCSGRGDFLEAVASQCPQASLSGMDIDVAALAIAKMRSKASGSSISYSCEDVFRFYEKNLADAPADKVFSNYPWGMSTKMFSRTSNYIEHVLKGEDRYGRPSSSDWVFNRVIVDSLKEGGVGVGIMANGACFKGTDKRVREYFVKNGYIAAVVALPKGVFAPYTMIQTSLIVLRPGGSKGVRFVDATDLGASDRRGCSVDEKAIDTIVERLAADSERSAFMTVEQIAAREFDLSAKRYPQKEIEVENGVNLGSVATITRGASVRAAELDALACEEDTGISYLNLGNISDGGIDDELPNLSSLDPKLEKYCIRDGNVLISKSGAPFKVAVAEVPEGRKVLANGNLYVLEVDRDKIDPHYLAAFFLSPAGKELLAREAVGTAIPNVPIRALSAIKVPLLDADRQKAIANAYLAKTDEIKVLKLRLEKARGEIADLFDEEG